MTLKKALLLAACLNLFFVATGISAASSKINMNAGQWEITSKMEMANLPFAMPAMTYSMCLSKDDLIPQQEMQTQQSNCEIKSQRISGNTVSWEISCDSDQGKSTSSGSITYSGDSLEGKMNMQMPGVGPMQQSMTGRRTGSCN